MKFYGSFGPMIEISHTHVLDYQGIIIHSTNLMFIGVFCFRRKLLVRSDTVTTVTTVWLGQGNLSLSVCSWKLLHRLLQIWYCLPGWIYNKQWPTEPAPAHHCTHLLHKQPMINHVYHWFMFVSGYIILKKNEKWHDPWNPGIAMHCPCWNDRGRLLLCDDRVQCQRGFSTPGRP